MKTILISVLLCVAIYLFLSTRNNDEKKKELSGAISESNLEAKADNMSEPDVTRINANDVQSIGLSLNKEREEGQNINRIIHNKITKSYNELSGADASMYIELYHEMIKNPDPDYFNLIYDHLYSEGYPKLPSRHILDARVIETLDAAYEALLTSATYRDHYDSLIQLVKKGLPDLERSFSGESTNMNLICLIRKAGLSGDIEFIRDLRFVADIDGSVASAYINGCFWYDYTVHMHKSLYPAADYPLQPFIEMNYDQPEQIPDTLDMYRKWYRNGMISEEIYVILKDLEIFERLMNIQQRELK